MTVDSVLSQDPEDLSGYAAGSQPASIYESGSCPERRPSTGRVNGARHQANQSGTRHRLIIDIVGAASGHHNIIGDVANDVHNDQPLIVHQRPDLTCTRFSRRRHRHG